MTHTDKLKVSTFSVQDTPLYTNEMEMFMKSPKYSNAILLVEHKLKLKSGLRTVIKDDIDLVWKDINEEFLATRLGKVWAECRGSKGRFSLKLYMDGIEEPELTEFLSYRSMLEYLELKFKNPGYMIPFIKYEEEDEINYNTILFAYVPLNKDIYEEGYSSDWVKTFLSSLLFSKFQEEIKSMLFDADVNVIPKNFMTIIGVLAFQGVFTGNASSLAAYFQFDKVKKQSIARYISTGMKNGVSIPIQKWILDYVKDNGLKKD